MHQQGKSNINQSDEPVPRERFMSDYAGGRLAPGLRFGSVHGIRTHKRSGVSGSTYCILLVPAASCHTCYVSDFKSNQIHEPRIPEGR